MNHCSILYLFMNRTSDPRANFVIILPVSSSTVVRSHVVVSKTTCLETVLDVSSKFRPIQSLLSFEIENREELPRWRTDFVTLEVDDCRSADVGSMDEQAGNGENRRWP